MNIWRLLFCIIMSFVLVSRAFSVTFFKNSKLLKAAKKNDSLKVSKYLQDGAEVDCVDDLSKKTALMLAAQQGNESIVSLLLQKGANKRLLDSKSRSALMYSSMNGSVSVVSTFLKDCDTNILNHFDKRGMTALHWALYKDKIDAAKKIIEQKPDLSVMDSNGNFPIFIAIDKDSSEVVEAILEGGYEINVQQPLSYKVIVNVFNRMTGYLEEAFETRGSHTFSALMYSSMKASDIKISQSIVNRGADLNLQSRSGYTALMYAAKSCQIDKVRYLVEQGSSLTLKNFQGEDALAVAIKNGCTQAQLYIKDVQSKGISQVLEPELEISSEEVLQPQKKEKEDSRNSPVARNYDF